MAASLSIAILGASPVACLCAAYLRAKLDPAQFSVQWLLPPEEQLPMVTRLSAASMAWLETMGLSAQRLVQQGIADIDLARQLDLGRGQHWWAASDYGMALDHLPFLQWFAGARAMGGRAEAWQFNSNILFARANRFDARALGESVHPGMAIHSERFMASVGKSVPAISLSRLPEFCDTGYRWQDASGTLHTAQLLIDCTGQLAFQRQANRDLSQQGFLVRLEEQAPTPVNADQPRQCYSHWSVSGDSLESAAVGARWRSQVLSKDICQLREHWCDQLIAIGSASDNTLDLLVSQADRAAFQCQLLASLLTNNTQLVRARPIFNRQCQLYRDEANVLHNLLCVGFGWTKQLSVEAGRQQDLFLGSGYLCQQQFGLLPESSIGALLWVFGSRPSAVSPLVAGTLGEHAGQRLDQLAERFAMKAEKSQAYPEWAHRLAESATT